MRCLAAPLLVAGASLVPPAVARADEPPPVAWKRSLDEGKKAADAAGKLLLLDFYSDL